MPVPFFAGLVFVSKAGCVGGLLSGVTAMLYQASEGGEVSKAEQARRLRRKKSVEVSRHEQYQWITVLGNIKAKTVLRAFAAGAVIGTIGGAVWTGVYGLSTTAVPLTKETFVQVLELTGVGLILYTPTMLLLTRTDRELEHGVPFFFFDGMMLGCCWFSAMSCLGYTSLAHTGLSATSGIAAMMLMVFVSKYAYFQSSKRVVQTGPIAQNAHRYLITLGLVSGTILVVALAVTPFYHPGNFLVWGITNPALVYTGCLGAECEIESEQVREYRKTVNADLLQQRKFIRALLPMAGLPFGYVADRDSVSRGVKIFLAGVGALGLGGNIFLFHDEWNAFVVDEASHEPIPAAIPYPEEELAVVEDKKVDV